MVDKQKMTGQKEQPIEAFNRLIFLFVSIRSVECGKQWKQNHLHVHGLRYLLFCESLLILHGLVLSEILDARSETT